jgi:hypothetical protein
VKLAGDEDGEPTPQIAPSEPRAISRADRVKHHRQAKLLCDHNLSQICLSVAVIQNPATAKNKDVELFNLPGNFPSGERASGDGVLDQRLKLAEQRRPMTDSVWRHADTGIPVVSQFEIFPA